MKLIFRLPSHVQLVTSYINLTDRSSGSASQPNQVATNVQHRFVFAKIGESHNEETADVEEIMSDQGLLAAVILHGFADDQGTNNCP